MPIIKKITEDNELYLYMNGKIIYKRWIDQGYSKVFDIRAYGKDTFVSITQDTDGTIRHRRNIFINGYTCNSQLDFWDKYTSQIPAESAKSFGKNLDAFNDAITGGGPGFPGDSTIEIIGSDKLSELFGQTNFEWMLQLLREAEFVNLIVERTTHNNG